VEFVPGAVIPEGGWRHVGCFQRCFDDVGFADPRAGCCRNGDGDEVACTFEGVDERGDIGG
jgi:hypothetical protein